MSCGVGWLIIVDSRYVPQLNKLRGTSVGRVLFLVKDAAIPSVTPLNADSRLNGIFMGGGWSVYHSAKGERGLILCFDSIQSLSLYTSI